MPYYEDRAAAKRLSTANPSWSWLVPVAMLAISATLIMVLIWISEPSRSAIKLGPPIMRYRGINFAGGEFNSSKNPGVPFKDYVYPDAKTVAPMITIGFNAARLPVRWERLQRSAMADLDKDEMARIDAAIRVLSPFDLIIIDLHNYARYRGQLLDAQGAGAAMLSDVWQRLARRYAKNPKIAFGVMNEPVDIGAQDWRGIAQATVEAIRATGARNLVLVPGTRYTGAHSWNQGGSGSNAMAWRDFNDPGNNFAIEMHQYLDADSSGTKDQCIDPEKAKARLNDATLWLRKQGFRGFLGEFGAAPNSSCLKSLDSLLEKLDNDADVWLGWTYWAAGAWWGNYPMSIQPGKAGAAKPQTQILMRHLPVRP